MSPPRQPLAIVGIGCKFPGGIESPDDLVAFLSEGRSAIREVPPDRWLVDAFYHPDFKKPGHIHARRGGFVDRVDMFDAGFFGISPHEARRMDPQQRWALETALRAIEDAGMPLERLAGRPVACIVGCSGHDYDAVQVTHAGRNAIGPTTNTGSALSIVSNRVAFMFDLRGPSFTVDTACSSSLIAFHHACRAIWSGDAEAALAGGVNLVLKPESTIGFSKGSYLSPDGECRAFSDHANGYVRSEGAAMILIKPLAAALADGDRIYALVRGSAINQDGRTPGMTLPSGTAQEAMLVAAYRDAGIDPREVAYVEAHGTGTRAGDPIEATAIGNVVGAGRADGVCWLGSVKTNLGHLESASGLAGLVKLALTLQRRRVFPNRNFRAPNPDIAFDALKLRVPTDAVALDPERPLYGGVNSFGFGGSNAHVVLASPPIANDSPPLGVSQPADDRAHALFLSARTASTLRTFASALAERVDDATLPDLAATLGRRRTRFEFRAAAVGTTAAELRESLQRFAREDAAADVVTGRVPEGRPAQDVVFLFTGQGPQWWRMGRDLFATEPTFRRAVERIDHALRRLGWLVDEGSSLVAELHADEAHSRIGETRIAQPAIFALQIGLVELLRERGVEPTAVIGHSIGELAAAACAGALSIDEAARIVYWRSRCQAQAEGAGAMAALGVSEAEAAALLAPYAGAVELAAVNGPRTVTVAGLHEAVAHLCAELDRRDVFCKALAVSVPFHCWLMDPIRESFLAGLGAVASRAGALPFYSTVTGDRLDAALDLDYWYRNIREPVRLHDGIAALARDGHTLFVEIGPHPILTRGALETLGERGARGTIIPTLRHDGAEPRLLAKTLAQLFAAGAACEPVPDGGGHAFVPFPPHPMEKQRHWLETRVDKEQRIGADRFHPHVATLERGVKAPGTFACTLAVDPRHETYLADHKVQGITVFPGAGQLETILAAGRRALGTDAVFLEEVEFLRPMVLDAEAEAPYRLDVYSDEGYFTLGAIVDHEAGAWLEHSRGRINHADGAPAPVLEPIEQVRARCDRDVPVDVFYQGAAASGLELGETFQVLKQVWVSPDKQTLARIEPPAALGPELARYGIHPAILDGVLQTAALGMLAGADRHALFLPQRVRRARLCAPYRGGALWCHSRVERDAGKDVTLTVYAATEAGEPVMLLEGLVVRRVRGTVAHGDRKTPFYEPAWQAAPRDDEPLNRPRGTWLVLTGPSSLAVSVIASLRLSGHRVIAVDPWRLDDLDRALDGVQRPEPITGIVQLGVADPGTAPPTADSARLAVERGPVATSHLLAAIGERGLWNEDGAEIWLVTAGTHGAIGEGDDAMLRPEGAALWGFGRVLSSEHPRHATTLVDLGAAPSATEVAALIAEIDRGPREHELAFRGDARYVLGLEALPAEGASRPQPVDVARTPVTAVVTTPGNIASIALRRQAFPLTPSEHSPKANASRGAAVGPDEVLLDVRAIGLNFKDVVVATAMLGDEAWEHGMSGATLGMDCAGVVAAVGANVTEFIVGDEVVGLAPSSAASRAVAHRNHLVKKPAALSFADAAAVPTAFITAGVALEQLARLQPGETVLVHAGAGGVGLAAIEIARGLGATVIATTGSEEKRAFLKALGVEHVFTSRSPRFRDDVIAATGGRGVDVVLNSVAGRLLTQSIRCLAPFGRFVEIGKADLYANRQIGLKFFAENRSFLCFDLNRMAALKRPDLAARFARYLDRIAAGEYRRSPVRRFGLGELADAVHALAQGKQIGKIVVDVPATGTLPALPEDALAFDPDKVWLVTGGCTGFGLAVAEWLVDRGARKLALWGRRGLPGDAEVAQVEALRARGAEVTVSRVDVTSPDQVACGVARLGPALGGVFHAAMVLDDGPLTQLDPARYARVVDPKLYGAWHLHAATADRALEHFVLFSSIASVVGTPGQASYAAANAGLDALAAYRRSLGLSALSINWGVLDGAGIVARASDDQRRKILGQGVGAFTIPEALALLERTLLDRPVRRVCARVEWKRLAQLGARRGRPGRFAALAGDAGASASGGRLSERLRDASDADREELVQAQLAAHVAQVAGLGAGDLDRDAGLDRFGFDSLMATQLQSWVETEVGVTIPLVRLLRGPSVRELAAEIVAGWSRVARGSGERADAIVHRITPGEAPRARLFCLPPMGADATIFAQWVAVLPDDIELCTLTLPALDGPLAHLLANAAELRDHVVDEIAPLVDLPFGIYGHSLGGWLALDLAHALRERGHHAKFVALGALPTLDTMRGMVPDDVTAADQITDDHVRVAMERMAIPRSAERAIAPLVRRDLWLGAATQFDGTDARRSPPAPVILMGGDTDPVTTVDKAASTAVYGESPDAIWRVPGGHFFLADKASQPSMQRHLSALAGRLIE